MKCKLLADCLGPTVVGKKGETVEIAERHLPGLKGLVQEVKKPGRKKK